MRLWREPKDHALDGDLFAIPVGRGRFLVYAPVRRVLFESNQSGVRQIQQVLKGKKSPKYAATRSLLDREGLFNEPDYPQVDLDRPFIPHSLTLSQTSACNLRCIYCYAHGGDKPQNMTWELAQASIDCVVRHIVEAEGSYFKLTFHGGGEPTILWQRLQRATEYAERLADKHALALRVTIVTNGTLIDAKKARWMADHISHVTVSMDGFREIQERQRPAHNGSSSFDAVVEGISNLARCDVDFAVRTTITGWNVREMAEFAKFVHGGGATGLQVEPFERVGRAKKGGIPGVDPDIFVEEYLRAVALTRSLDFGIYFSGDKFDLLRGVFCGADGEMVCVLPKGQITSCTQYRNKTGAFSEPTSW